MTKVQRESVIREALDLLNEVGVDGLTTRKLAERVGVQQPALYWHFENKRALLDALAEAMLAEGHARALPKPDEDWPTFLGENARSFRHALLAYRDGALIHAGTRPSHQQFESIEAQLHLLCEAGFSPGDAAKALLVIGHYVVGSAIEQQASDTDDCHRKPEAESVQMPPLVAAAFEEVGKALPDAAFEYGLAVLIEGLTCNRSVRRRSQVNRSKK